METPRSALVRMCALLIVVCAAPAQAQRADPVADRGSRFQSRDTADNQRATATLNRLPIRFEPTDHTGTFLARGMGRAIRLSGTSIDFPIGSGSSRADSIRVQFIGAKRSSRVTGLDPLPGRVNYLLSDDPSRWRTNVPTYARARTASLYRGIDIEYYGTGGLLEYDLIVRPGSSIDAIRLAITGAAPVAISEAGDVVHDDDDRVLLRKPIAYQTFDHTRREVAVAYQWRDDRTLGFVVGPYDRHRPLVIDPIVDYSFTFGGSGDDRVYDLAVDDVGALYVGGITHSSDFPTVNPADHREDAGDAIGCWEGLEPHVLCGDAVVAKLSANGSELVYATYVGMANTAYNIAVDGNHALYFAGVASAASPGGSSFGKWAIGKLAPDGSRFLYTFFTPPATRGFAIVDLAIAPNGSAYMATWDGVATLSPAGDNFHPILVLSTPLTYPQAVAVGAGGVFVAGIASWGFATTPGAAQTQIAGGADGFLMRLTMDGAVVYSTLLGGSDDDAITDLAVDPEGAAYVVGIVDRNDATSPPTSPRALVAKIASDGAAVVYATIFPYVPPTYLWRSPIRVSVNHAEAHTATCVFPPGPGPESDRSTCQFWKVDPTGALRAPVPGIPSNLFAMDQAGAAYFGVLSGTNGGDVNIRKYSFGVTSMSLTASERFPARFGIPITWTAQAIADDAAEYSFIRYSAAGGWIEAQAFGASPTYTWTPKSWDVGNDIVCVLARLIGLSGAPMSRCVDFTITGVGRGEPPVLAPAADFNADRRPDLIWINSATGQLAMWNVGGGAHGEQVLGGGYLTGASLPAGWRVAGSGDISGDGHTDLFLQSATGLLGAWFFDGSTLRSGITLTPGQVGDPNWQIRAVGDLNHDGHPDLIWQYGPTGQVAFWLMNGTIAIDYIVPNVAAPGGDWEIVGTGDSNRDGERDIFWQQRSTGTLAVWWMNGTSIAGASLMSASPTDPKWRVVAVADVDGDAYSDVVFQHSDSHMAATWYLQGDTVRFGLMLNPSTITDPAWRITGPR